MPENRVTISTYSSFYCIEDGRKHCIELLQTGKGDSAAILLSCRSEFAAKAVIEYARQGEFQTIKRYAYLSALSYIQSLMHTRSFSGSSSGAHLLYPLLSDNKAVLHWHSQFLFPTLLGSIRKPDVLNPHANEYHAAQLRLILAGEMALVHERSERFLQSPPSKKSEPLVIDYLFFRALAEGNIPAMEEQIGALLEPKMFRKRSSGLFWNLEPEAFSPWATIFGKLAFRMGYTLNIDHPKFPRRLMEVSEGEYEIPDEFFLRDYDIFTPFSPDQCRDLKGDASKLSPRRPGEPPLTFKEQCELMGIEL